MLATAGATTVLATAGLGVWLAINIEETSGPSQTPFTAQTPSQNALPHSGGPVPPNDHQTSTPPPISPLPTLPEALTNLGPLAGGLLGSRPLPLPTLKPPPTAPNPTKSKISLPPRPLSPSKTRPAKPKPNKPTTRIPDPCATFHDIRRDYCYEVLHDITGQ
ncbi:hypothetical protein GCM10009555_042950 [Acrocarpospora macrocephala]|uniref:Uncharacterized protein n=1 Tax=Acrocarpospora macrocephala TaxID=150177 RepID=A0A5M3X2U9_9ACTN|nr:hypothetical protein Amac_090410 [Acrocarpospora macrocephala]